MSFKKGENEVITAIKKVKSSQTRMELGIASKSQNQKLKFLRDVLVAKNDQEKERCI